LLRLRAYAEQEFGDDQPFCTFLNEDSGATAVEYGLIAVGISRKRSVLAIGLVSVAALRTRMMAKSLVVFVTAPAARMSAVARKSLKATVLLEAFLTITMSLAFSDQNESAGSISWQQVVDGGGDWKCRRPLRHFSKREQRDQGKDETVHHAASR
jgi:Flp pilus assembly pilin Flp